MPCRVFMYNIVHTHHKIIKMLTASDKRKKTNKRINCRNTHRMATISCAVRMRFAYLTTNECAFSLNSSRCRLLFIQQIITTSANFACIVHCCRGLVVIWIVPFPRESSKHFQSSLRYTQTHTRNKNNETRRKKNGKISRNFSILFTRHFLHFYCATGSNTSVN